MTAIGEININTESTASFDRPGPIKTEKFNYIAEMQKLVAQLLVQIGRIASNDHWSIEKMKERYMVASMDAARLQSDYGRTGRNLAVLTFVIFCSRLGFPNTDDKEILNIISQQTPTLGGMWTSGIQSQIQKENALATLELEKYRSKTAKTQSEGSAKQDLVALLQSLAENIKSASRANG